MRPGACRALEVPARTKIDIGQIFREHGDAFRERHTASERQLKVMLAIQRCRTAALGGHVYSCTHCDYQVPAYNSCRDRHCPKCQPLAQARWIAQRKQHILPITYFHLVFTLPHDLRPLAMRHRVEIYQLLFASASRTLLELGADPKHLGAQLGVSLVLHTWTRDLHFHPHVHGIVTAGGLSADGERWVDLKGDGTFLFPVRVLSSLFRGKFLAGLQALVDAGKINVGDPSAYRRLRDSLYRKDWIVYAKQPFRGAEHVYEYLGRYTHRVGLSNSRLQNASSDGIQFATKNGMTTTLPPDEFIRRFLLHVLPKGFVKIRHYGLMAASNVKTRLAAAKQLLASRATARHAELDELLAQWIDFVADLTALVPVKCPKCERGELIPHLVAPVLNHPPQRAPPSQRRA